MSNGDFRDPRDRPASSGLGLVGLIVILVIAVGVSLLALRSAYQLGQAHPDVKLYCANDRDLPADISLIQDKRGHEAGHGTGIYYEAKAGVVRIVVPSCGDVPPIGCRDNPALCRQPPKVVGDSSKFYRDSPGGRVPDDRPSDNASNGSPAGAQIGVSPNCSVDPSSPDCRRDRKRSLSCSDEAKYWFNQGEADMAHGDTDAARYDFQNAIAAGRDCGSEYAVLAAKQLAALNLPCEYTSDSLARISLDADQNPDGGQVIPLANRKQALKALGYYDGPIDPVYGPNTRLAIQGFERDLGFSETGDLTPLETVYLICSAAQNANDAQSVNVLGIMYITGLGVVQNTDTGLTWLKKAATRGEPSALLNLALVYGTNIILSSYELCDLPENYEIAASYLHEAAVRGQPAAIRYWQILKDPRYHTDRERWDAIKLADLAGKPPNVQKIIQQHVGRGCKVN